MDPLFAIWWDFAVRTEGYFSQEVRELVKPGDYPPMPEHKWHWDGHEHVDPAKEADALTERLRNGSDHLADAWSKKGKIWEQERKVAAESLGVSEEEYLVHVRSYLFGQRPDAGLQDRVERQIADLIEESLS